MVCLLLISSFSFIFLALIGYFSGPVTSMYVAFVFDILNFLFSKDGTVFVPWYTLLEIAGGFIYGITLYRNSSLWVKNPLADTVLKCAVCKTLINVLINICGNSTLNIYLYDVAKNGIWVYMLPRIIKNLTLLPIEIAVLVLIITFVRKEKQFSVWLNK